MAIATLWAKPHCEWIKSKQHCSASNSGFVLLLRTTLPSSPCAEKPCSLCRTCDLNIASCVVAHSSGKWGPFVFAQMGRWFVADWSRTSQFGPFCVSDSKHQPMWSATSKLVVTKWLFALTKATLDTLRRKRLTLQLHKTHFWLTLLSLVDISHVFSML